MTTIARTLPASPGLMRRLALSLWIVLLVHFNPDGAAGARFVFLTRAIVEHHSLNVDAFGGASRTEELLRSDVFVKDGHTWVDTNPGMSFLASPVWAAWVAIVRVMHAEQRLLTGDAAYYAAHFLGTAVTTALATVLVALLLYRWVAFHTGSTRRGVAAAVVYTLGTNAFFLSTLLMQHSAIALLTLVFVMMIAEPGAVGSFASSHWRDVALGAAAGVGLLVDLSAVPALAVLAPWYVFRPGSNGAQRTWLVRLLHLAAGAAIPVAVLLWYQGHSFGNALYPAQHYYFAGNTVGISGAFMSLPRPATLVGILAGSRAGLWIYAPLTIPATLVLSRTIRDRDDVGARATLALAVAYVLYASCFTASVEYSYFGPRYLSPIVPLLCAMLFLHSPRPDAGWTRAAILASLAINVMGAENGIYSQSIARTAGLWLLRGPWLPVVDQLRGDFGMASATPYGALVLMLLALALLWRGPWQRRGRMK